ncbi:sedoheptulokinase [Latimeria chalumnae]|uniref:sedoheptulokinase n=1 Tax=Latimeria chalumnae TaxID=7897 RepID=UPI00313BFCC6
MAASTSSDQYVLGIDLGTTSVKAVLLDSKSGNVTCSQRRETQADTESEVKPQGKEQDVSRIVRALNECIAALPSDGLQRVVSIGVSGQMHGVMFWKTGQGCDWVESGNGRCFQPKQPSHLITWEDGRCSWDFLSSLPPPHSHLSLATGFGCATIFWYLINRPDFLVPFDAAGTIQDYVVAMLCNLEGSQMSVQNAASWGYFNTRMKTWDFESLTEAAFPVSLLPKIIESGSIIGKTAQEWYGIPKGTEVGAALGDFQCSVYSCMTEKTDAVLNISTSAQLTFALPSGFQPPDFPDSSSPVAYFPYFDGVHLAVAASLNGGNVIATFVAMLTQWLRELGVSVPDSAIYSLMEKAALNQSNTDLDIVPTICGERHLPDQLASVSSISSSNLSLGHVTRALCSGIVRNLQTMLPCQQLIESGVKRIMGSGSALSRNEVLKQEVERLFPLPVVYGKDVDSAVGVAMVMLNRK